MNELDPIDKNFKFERSDNLESIVPVNKLYERSSRLNANNAPNSEGIDPARLFVRTFKDVKADKALNSLGSSPNKPWLGKEIERTRPFGEHDTPSQEQGLE